MLETVAFGVATICICVYAFFKGKKWMSLASAATGIGWLIYLFVIMTTVFSATQAILAGLDAVVCAAILFSFRKDDRPAWVFIAMGAVFMAMIGMHLSQFATDGKSGYPYHTWLNVAYAAQLALLWLVTKWDVLESRASADRHSLGNSDPLAGGVVK